MPGNKQNTSLATRREILKEGLLTPLGKIVTAGSSIAWISALIRDTLIPSKWQHLLAAIPNWWGWQAWLAIFSCSFAIIALEGSYRVTRKRTLEYWNAEQSLRQDIERLKQALAQPRISAEEKRQQEIVLGMLRRYGK